MNVQDVLPFVHDGNIVWTMTTKGYTKYTLNLFQWLKTKATVKWNLCIVCCDMESHLFFRRELIPHVVWKYDVKPRKTQDCMAAFGTPSFEVCNRDKVLILEWFCLNFKDLGLKNSLYLDGDIVVQKDPWPLILPLFLADGTNLLFQCDCNNGIEHTDCGVICSGVIATRHVSVSQGKLYEWDDALWNASCRQDQLYIGAKIAAGPEKWPFRILSRRLFGNGGWQKAGAWEKDNDWCLLHYNQYISGSKRSAMQKAGHWLIPH